MKLTVKRDKEHYSLRSVTWCCREMGTNWLMAIIGYGLDDSVINTLNQVVMRVDYSLGSKQEMVEVKYCPWCGEAVEIVVEEGNENTFS